MHRFDRNYLDAARQNANRTNEHAGHGYDFRPYAKPSVLGAYVKAFAAVIALGVLLASLAALFVMVQS